MIERIIASRRRRRPRGPYSPAVRAGDFIYVSGQVPVDPVTDQVSLGDIRPETRQVLNNIKRILEGCGATMAQTWSKCGVYLADGERFRRMNEVYAEFFGDAKPARTTIIVAALPTARSQGRNRRRCLRGLRL